MNKILSVMMALLLCINSFSASVCGVMMNGRAEADLEKRQAISVATMGN